MSKGNVNRAGRILSCWLKTPLTGACDVFSVPLNIAWYDYMYVTPFVKTPTRREKGFTALGIGKIILSGYLRTPFDSTYGGEFQYGFWFVLGQESNVYCYSSMLTRTAV